MKTQNYFVFIWTVAIVAELTFVIGCSSPSKQDPRYPEKILLKDLKPKVLHKVPVTHIEKAKYPVINMHTHAHYAQTPEELDRWVEIMDAAGKAVRPPRVG